MKYVAFILWMIFTPITAFGTMLFVFGLYADEWFELGSKILDSK